MHILCFYFVGQSCIEPREVVNIAQLKEGVDGVIGTKVHLQVAIPLYDPLWSEWLMTLCGQNG